MKNYLIVLLSLLMGAGTLYAVDDPGQAYADAFITIQEGQTAEQNSDWVTAVKKYTEASAALQAIRKNSADWNPQVVEFRLKDVQEKLAAARAKAPAAPTPEPAAVPAKVPIPTPTPTPTGEATATPAVPLNVELATPQATTRLRTELDRLQAENTRLLADLDAAKKTPAATPAPVVDTTLVDHLKEENQLLTQKIQASENNVAELKQQLAAKPTESPELTSLRAELAGTKVELEKTRAIDQTEITNIEQQNQDLAAQLADARSAATAKGAAVDSEEIKKLRNELAQAQAETDAAKKLAAQPVPTSNDELKKLRSAYTQAQATVDEQKKQLERAEIDRAERAAMGRQLADLESMNATLRKEVTVAEKKAARKAPADTKDLQTQLANAKADLEAARKTNESQISDLQRQNKALAVDLAAAKNQAGKSATESETLAKLRKELDAANVELANAKQAAAKTHDLEAQNKDLAAQLASAQKQAASPSADAEVKKLRRQLTAAEAEAATAKQANSQLSNLERENRRLTADLAEARGTIVPVPAGQNFGPARPVVPGAATAHDMTDLQNQNAELKQLLAEVKKKAATTKVSDAEELKKARQDAENAKDEAETAKKSAAKADEVARANKELQAKLTATDQRVKDLEKQVASKAASLPADTTELNNLRTQLADAHATAATTKDELDKAQAAAAKAGQVTKENKDLQAKLATAERRVNDLEKQSTNQAGTAAVESVDLKRARTELADAKSKAEDANKAATAKADELAKQNVDLSDKLTTANDRVSELEKKVAAKSAALPANTKDLDDLRKQLTSAQTELSAAKQTSAQAAALTTENQQLSSALVAQKDQVATLAQTRAELADARAAADKAKADAALAAQLQEENKVLAGKLEEAQKGPFVRPLTTGESTEINQLKGQLEDAQTEVLRAEQNATRVGELTKENATLQQQLEAAKQASAPRIEMIDMNHGAAEKTAAIITAKDASLMKSLREENSYMRHLLETYAETNPELKPRLQRYKASTDQPTPTGN